MPGFCIILPHDIFNSLSLGVTGYHFHLFFFSFLGLSKLNSTEQWCLSLSELSCRTVFAFETSSTSTPTSPNRTTTEFWVCTCTFHCCFDLFQLKGKRKTGGFYFKCWTGPPNGWFRPWLCRSFLVQLSHMSNASVKWRWRVFPSPVLSPFLLTSWTIRSAGGPQLRSPGSNAISLQLFSKLCLGNLVFKMLCVTPMGTCYRNTNPKALAVQSCHWALSHVVVIHLRQTTSTRRTNSMCRKRAKQKESDYQGPKSLSVPEWLTARCWLNHRPLVWRSRSSQY